MTNTTYYVPDSDAMEALGASLVNACQTGSKVIFLYGNLGAGKTTLVRGFLRALGFKGSVKSPTFTVVESYEVNHQLIHHFDLYRLNDPEELEQLGIRDYLDEGNICFFEWPEKTQNNLPSPHLSCYIEILKNGRNVRIVNRPLA
ncbi:MAG: tRNA (adenosine(37)-N6)-threonylcarbamoyltransferase complex ATPase subunit type 1 TsaE [Legionellales bacterium]|nr:tRNA (adenosine(37)-N6)-threonylcarbamoyltransferase complex ATPase subunit type 1 TsaE [Legionellales bacterium]